MLKAVTKLFGNENEKILKRYRTKVVQINTLESEMETLKDEDFPGRTEQFRKESRKALSKMTCFQKPLPWSVKLREE